MNTRLLIAACGSAVVAACATASTFTIENRLQQLGMSQAWASCYSDELSERLDDQQLAEFARFTVGLTQPENTAVLVATLADIADPDIARAVAGTSLVCAVRR